MFYIRKLVEETNGVQLLYNPFRVRKGRTRSHTNTLSARAQTMLNLKICWMSSITTIEAVAHEVRDYHVKMSVVEQEFDHKIREIHNINNRIRKLGQDLENELNRKTGDHKSSREKAKKLFNELSIINKSEETSKRKFSTIFTGNPAAKREVSKERCWHLESIKQPRMRSQNSVQKRRAKDKKGK